MTNKLTCERIEKLTDAKKAIQANYPPSNYTMLREALDLSMELIDAEIERQSVTDEDVANAIEHLEYWQESVKEDDGEDVLEDIYEKSVKNFHAACRLAIQALQAYRTVTVTWEGDPDDRPSAICSGCENDLAEYDWYDKLVFGPRNYCPYCGGRIVKQITEEYTGEDEWEEEV